MSRTKWAKTPEHRVRWHERAGQSRLKQRGSACLRALIGLVAVSASLWLQNDFATNGKPNLILTPVETRTLNNNDDYYDAGAASSRHDWEVLQASYSRHQQGQRSPVRRDEFFVRSPPQAEIDAFFHFDPSRIHPNNMQLRPLWSCSFLSQRGLEDDSSSTNSNKLVFIHMSRSAGSTFRALFRVYAAYCKASVAVVRHCVDLALPSATADVWMNDQRSQWAAKECLISTAMNRTGHEIGVDQPITTDFLVEQQVDLLGGHIPLGSTDTIWDKEKMAIQYFVVFRHPLHRMVSERMVRYQQQQINPRNRSIDELAEHIRQAVADDLAQGKRRDRYSTYLITPQQKDWVEKQGIAWSKERRVNLTLSNLYQNRVMVGIMESMRQTLEMLHYTMDDQHELKQLFKYFASPEILSKVNFNDSFNTTRAIVSRLEQNETTMAMMEEYLAYELRIYSTARKLHLLQYESMVHSRQSLDNQ